MTGRRRIIVPTAAAFIILGLAAVLSAEESLSFTEAVKLYPAPSQHDSYSLYYDITIESPGLICIGLEVSDVFPEVQNRGKFISVSLRQRDEEREVRFVELGREGGTFSYGVDAYELNLTKGEYRIVVSNWSLQNTIAAKLVALYPGTVEAEVETKILMIPGSAI